MRVLLSNLKMADYIVCFLKVVQGFTEKMAEAAAKELKICKKQVSVNTLKAKMY